MARTGRPRTPTALKVLRGNPGHRPLPTDEPKPREISPDKPAWLSKEASEEWDRLLPELERMRLVTVVDGAALAIYCQALSDLAYLRAAIEKYRETAGKITFEYTSEGGSPKELPIPELTLADKCVQTIKTFAVEFGLTPSSRGHLGGRGSGKENEGSFQDFVAKGKRKA